MVVIFIVTLTSFFILFLIKVKLQLLIALFKTLQRFILQQLSHLKSSSCHWNDELITLLEPLQTKTRRETNSKPHGSSDKPYLPPRRFDHLIAPLISLFLSVLHLLLIRSRALQSSRLCFRRRLRSGSSPESNDPSRVASSRLHWTMLPRESFCSQLRLLGPPSRTHRQGNLNQNLIRSF